MKALNGKSYPWLEKTGQIWKYELEGYLGILGAVSLAVLIVSLLASLVVRWAWIVGASLMALYFLLGLASILVFYYTIRCPACGYNPTRKKDGKWASTRYLEGVFKKMELCPACEKDKP
ncbi:hypothetical protein BH09VER1_BH09VER1_55470 [soil metagenome]